MVRPPMRQRGDTSWVPAPEPPSAGPSPVSASGESGTDGAEVRHPLLDYLAINVADWTRQAAGEREAGRRSWTKEAPTWGIFRVPESELGILPEHAVGLRTLELGCGTGYVSAWLSRRGGTPVALDPTPSQLEIAGELQREFGTSFPLVRAAAEHLPFAEIPSIWRSASTGLPSGPIRTSGFRRWPEYFVRMRSWSSSATARSSCCALPRTTKNRQVNDSCDRSSACTVSTGASPTAPNST